MDGWMDGQPGNVFGRNTCGSSPSAVLSVFYNSARPSPDLLQTNVVRVWAPRVSPRR